MLRGCNEVVALALAAPMPYSGEPPPPGPGTFPTEHHDGHLPAVDDQERR